MKLTDFSDKKKKDIIICGESNISNQPEVIDIEIDSEAQEIKNRYSKKSINPFSNIKNKNKMNEELEELRNKREEQRSCCRKRKRKYTYSFSINGSRLNNIIYNYSTYNGKESRKTSI